MFAVFRRYGLCVALSLPFGCNGTEDTVTFQNPADPSSIDDAAPAPASFDPSLTYESSRDGSQNHSTDRFRFDVAAFGNDAEKAAAATLYPSHAAFLTARPGAIPSVQTVATYLKQLDDTIYAGVENAAQVGLAPTLLPKRTILTEATQYLLAHRSQGADEAIALVAAAIRLGGGEAGVPADLEPQITEVTKAFAADSLASTPFGFYTWSDELRGIWQQDRLLQRSLSAAATCALAQAISADAGRAGRYQKLVELYSRLTNPLESSLVDLLPMAGTNACLGSADKRAFLSASRSVETTLFDKMYPRGVPAGANLMQDLVDAIRNGTVDLAPKPGDGWYQQQEFALETLLVTDKSEERSKIAFMGKYKKRLQEAFETMLVEHRETHAKQSGNTTTAVGVALPPVPTFRVEPLATVFVRHARSYVFLEAALDAALGAGALDAATVVDAGGSQTETLRTRIRRARDLFYGVYLAAAQDLGMHAKLDAAGDPTADAWTDLARAADLWLAGLATDPVAKADVRVMIPIADLGNGRARYWAVIGVRTTLASYSFLQGNDTSPPKPEDEARVGLPTEQFLEVTSSAVPLSRDAFRALCDQNVTAQAIQSALEAR